jgi:hypothetical protein
MLGLTVMLIWCKKNWLNKLASLAIDKLTEQIKNISSIINIFNTLKDLIADASSNLGVEEIINWFTSFATKEPLIGIVFSAVQIISIISEILMPTVKVISYKFNLTKS